MRTAPHCTSHRKGYANYHTRDPTETVSFCSSLLRQSRTYATRYQTLQLYVEDEDGDSLGSCKIDAADIITDFVHAGAGFIGELLKDKVQPIEVDGVHIDDRDSVLGTQDAATNFAEPEAGEKSMSWDALRGSVIPSCVKDITFTITEEDLTTTTLEQLQNQFPGVAIVMDGVIAVGEKARKEPEQKKARIRQEKARIEHENAQIEQEKAQKEVEQEKPKGIKQMVIELDDTELAQNPELDNAIRRRFPWAVVDTKAGPNTSRKRARRMTATRRVDPLQHLDDWGFYAREPPSDEEFGYHYPIGEGWDDLPFTRRIEVSHARAIQQYHGKVLVESGCSHCAEMGYTCKVYPAQLGNLTHIAFGHSCQNCRLQQVQCDLPAAIKDRRPSAPPPIGPAALRIDIENVSDLRATTVPETPPTTTVTPKPSLQSRITYGNYNGAQPTDGEENEEGTTATTPYRTPTGPSDRMSEILRFADHIGLGLPEKGKTVIHSMYETLRKAREIAPYGTHKHVSLQQHYENLVNLYILTHRRGEHDLAYIVLLRIQNTNYCCLTELPSAEVVVRAFEYLAPTSPLCRWFAILYSFLWGNIQLGEWEEFTNNHSQVKARPIAFAKLLYAITHNRDRLTMGGDAAVLRRWCDVHNHVNPEEKDRCEKEKSNLKLTPEDADRIENGLALARAEQVRTSMYELHVRHTLTSYAKIITELGSGSAPYAGGKRKADGSPTHSYKFPNRGRGRPRGRGRGCGSG
jgi:hypothetical protein